MAANEDRIFRALAAPLVEYLANKHVTDSVHVGICADLYDLVNEHRDNEIRRLERLLDGHTSSVPINVPAIKAKIAFLEGR